MSNGLDQVPENGYSSKVRGSYPSQEQVPVASPDKPVKNRLSIDRHPPAKASSYQEAADPSFDSMEKDYAQAKVLYTDKAMKGRGSKELYGFLVISSSLEAFIKWVEGEEQRVALEVTITRRNNYQQNYWAHVKQAFQAELDRLNQQRQAKP